MKNNTFFKLFIIILIGITFRVWFLDKPHGLWNDEYVSWFIASQDTFTSFWTNMINNCHTPLYYLYIKLWMLFFSDSDLSLRFSSVLPSIISIPIMYLVGKEYLNKYLGIICAIFTSISSFCIYFAQEARLYSLLFLISSFIILFFIKIAKIMKKKDIITYFLLNGILCLTHTLGIIFSFFNISLLILYLIKVGKIKTDKYTLKKILTYSLPFVLIILILSPFLFNIATSKNLSQFWSNFSLSKILCNFIDYFSPIQTNLQSTQNRFINYIIEDSKINYVFIIFGIFPTLLSLYLVIKALKSKDKLLNYLSFSTLLFFVTLIILSLMGKMILITKYSVEIYPVLLLLVSYGLTQIQKVKLRTITLYVLVILNFFYLIYGADSAPKRTRAEGHLAVANLLKESNLKNTDKVILTYYGPDKFYKYLDKTDYKFYSINKYNFNYSMYNNPNYFDVIKNGKNKYKKIFEEKPNKAIQKYVNSNILYELKKGDRIGIVTLDNVSFLSERNINVILENEKKYNNTPFIFLVFSNLKNELINSIKQELILDSFTQSGDWSLYVYKKND